MLDTQYRMHPSISSFPAAEFYRGIVRDGTVDENGRVSKELDPPRSVYLRALDLSTPTHVVEGSPSSPDLGEPKPSDEVREAEVLGEDVQCEEEIKNGPSVIFLDHAGKETTRDRSRVNHTEAHIITSVVVDLLLSNPVSLLALISPDPFLVFLFVSIFSFVGESRRPSRAAVVPPGPPWDSPVAGPRSSESRSGPWRSLRGSLF